MKLSFGLIDLDSDCWNRSLTEAGGSLNGFLHSIAMKFEWSDVGADC